jgi:hypothetical protein
MVPEDERSVPPAGDLATEFFSGPPSWPAPRGAVEGDPFAFDALDKHARSLAPQAVARRALFARYVRGAVGVSLLLCVAAFLKTALTHDEYEPPRRSASAAQAPPLSDLGASAAQNPAETHAGTLAAPVLQGEGAADAGDGGRPAPQPATLRVR